MTSADFEQFVRDATPETPSTSSLVGAATVTLTCTFRGDALGATTWTKAGGSGDLTSGEDTYTIVAGTYNPETYMRTDKLVIVGVEVADAGNYVCTAVYTQGGVSTSASQSLLVHRELKF